MSTTENNQPNALSSGPLVLLGGGTMCAAITAALSATHGGPSELRVWARQASQSSAIAGACAKGEVQSYDSLTQAVAGAHTIVFCVADKAIASLAIAVADALRGQVPNANAEQAYQRCVALHTSGYLASSTLGPLAGLGIACGVMHPITSVPAQATAEERKQLFVRAFFGVSGTPASLERARELACLLGGRAVSVLDESRALYHGAAALLSGGLVALFHEAESSLAQALGDEVPAGDGGSGQELKKRLMARDILRGLLASTASNLTSKAPMDALTGPLARGDLDVVEGHKRAFFNAQAVPTGQLYEHLLGVMEQLVEARGESSADGDSWD